MSDRSKTFWLGVFIIVAIGITTWLLLFLRPSMGDGGTLLRVRFSNIEKVSIGTRVTFAGKPVGEVVAIQEILDARSTPPDNLGNFYFYELLLRVDSSVQIYNYDEIILSTAGLLGEKSIAILPKETPPGAPSAHEITPCILYAQGGDSISATLDKLSQVAATFDATLDKISHFLETSGAEVQDTLSSIASASKEVERFFARTRETQFIDKASIATQNLSQAMLKTEQFLNHALERQLIERMENALSSLQSMSDELVMGRGTLGRLIYDDSLFSQISSTVELLRETLCDINNYGLLFQYDKTWQRQRLARLRACENPSP